MACTAWPPGAHTAPATWPAAYPSVFPSADEQRLSWAPGAHHSAGRVARRVLLGGAHVEHVEVLLALARLHGLELGRIDPAQPVGLRHALGPLGRRGAPLRGDRRR